MLLVHTAPVNLFLLHHFFVVFNHSKLGGGGDVGAGYYLITDPISFFTVSTCITGIVARTFCRYISTSGSPELAIYRLSSSQLLTISARVGHLTEALTHSLFTRLLAFHQSLISSTISTSRPTLPRLPVGGGRTVPVPVYPVRRPGPCRSPGLPSILSRVVTARPSSARPPLVAVPDRSKGVVPSYWYFF